MAKVVWLETDKGRLCPITGELSREYNLNHNKAVEYVLTLMERIDG